MLNSSSIYGKRFKEILTNEKLDPKDTHCSDKCCGSDVKREDCKCPADCPHCNCNDPKVGGGNEDAEQIRKGGAGKSSYTGTRVHKDKKKEAAKKEGRRKIKDEDDNSYAGGALGPAAAAGHSRSGDWYASGDYRVPKMLGAVIQKRTSPELLATSISGKRKKRRKSKKKK